MALWLLKRWEGSKTRLVMAHVASWIICALIGGFVMAYRETFTLEAAGIYALPQLVWFAVDLMLLRRGQTA